MLLYGENWAQQLGLQPPATPSTNSKSKMTTSDQIKTALLRHRHLKTVRILLAGWNVQGFDLKLEEEKLKKEIAVIDVELSAFGE
ncbi:hypothetical protein HDV00_012608 [Rhizophlyctis rosea]|nr:hypothetical protein HDV00_012608 [Rhizophlyctis rosea]